MENNVEEAQWAQAKALYMEFRSIREIVNKTGLSFYRVRRRAYGPNGALKPSTDSWYYERLDTNREEFQELGARNLWLAQQITQKALYESYESLKVLSKRKNKKTGEKVPLSPQEIKALADSIAVLDKLLRLKQGLPTEITELQAGEMNSNPQDMALDMDKVAEALRLDPAMRKLLGGSGDGAGTDNTAERVHKPGSDRGPFYVRDWHGRFARPQGEADLRDDVLEVDKDASAGSAQPGADGSDSAGHVPGLPVGDLEGGLPRDSGSEACIEDSIRADCSSGTVGSGGGSQQPFEDEYS